MSDMEQLLVDILLDLQLSFYDAEGWIANLPTYPAVGQTLWRRLRERIGLKPDPEPKELWQEISRIMVTDWGLAKEIEVEVLDDTFSEVRIEKCRLLSLERELQQRGVTPYICPVVNCLVLAREETIPGCFVEKQAFSIEGDKCYFRLTTFRMKPDLTLSEVIKGSPFYLEVSHLIRGKV